MSRRFAIAFAAVAPLFLLAPKLAHAGLEACGNIDVRANATCKVEAKAECSARCTDVNLTAACEGKIEVDCDAKCNVKAEASCTGSCNTDCRAKCTANPGTFDCKADCTGSCGAKCAANCEAQASGGTASASCKANCEANCSAKCEGQCNVTPPSAQCDAKCNASCQGSCEGQVAVDCQGQCRATYDAPKCRAELKAKCEGGCTGQGSMFCDGEYVDTGGNLASCADALAAALNIKVDVSGSANCVGSSCEAEGKVSASACSSTPGEASHGAWFAPGLLAFAAVGASVARRKRRS